MRSQGDYSVTLHRDGTAELVSWEGLNTAARYSGAVTLTDYGKLCYFIQRQRFDQLAPWFAEGSSDQPTVVVKVNANGRQTTVSDYAGVGPIELWAIQELIDAVKHHIAWKRAP